VNREPRGGEGAGMEAWEIVVVNKYVPQLRIGLHLLL
jgi:hypothetical protein